MCDGGGGSQPPAQTKAPRSLPSLPERAKHLSLLCIKNIVRSAELYETLNHINATLQIGRMFEKDGLIILESSIFPYALNEQSLLNVVMQVQFLADQYDDRLHASFGGELFGPSLTDDVIDV